MTQEESSKLPRGLSMGILNNLGPRPEVPTAKSTDVGALSEEAPTVVEPTETKEAFDTSDALSQRTAAPHRQDDKYFNDFFDENEDKQITEELKHAEIIQASSVENEIEERLSRALKTLRQANPEGGVKAFRFIDTAILREAPADYFLRLEPDVRAVTDWVQTTLSEKGTSDIIGASQANPFDEELQDKAFRIAHAIATEYMSHLPYKGAERATVVYMACADVIGMSRIDPLWHDPSIDEIMINGPHDIQIEIKGKLHKVPSCQFRDASHLKQLLERIYSTIGKSLSRSTPYLDGRLYDQSRIAATDLVISPEGPNVSIRRHPERYWTPMDLIAYGAASEEMFTDVGNMINKGCSCIVIGGTSSGKTSLLNAISGFIPADQRVLTLEDNLELKLHPHKLKAAAMECVPANPNKEGDKGVTMRELVRASLRMRPDGIIVGEVRDGAMYDLCQALNTGHWGFSTVHANSPRDGIYRMQSLVAQAEVMGPDQALPLIGAAFDLIMMQERFPQDGSRKITQICEIDPYPERVDGQLVLGVNPIWKFVANEKLEEGRVVGQWLKVGEISALRRENRHLDLTPDKTWPELVELCTIPEQS